MRGHITQHDEHTSSDVAYYTQFDPKRSQHHSAMNPLTPIADHETLTAQFNDVNVQRVIRVLRDGEQPPSQPNFESQFFKKGVRNHNRLQVINNLLYRQYVDHTGKPTSKQTGVPDDIIK